MTGVRKLVLRLRAIDGRGSDRAAWECRREASGFFWWYRWPCCSERPWMPMLEIEPMRDLAQAEQAARAWFAEHRPGLQVEITAGHSEVSEEEVNE